MNTAQVAIFKAAGAPFEFTERPLPACGEGQALVAISLAMICGSDLHTTDGRRTEPRPCVLGHEAVGRVVAVGPGRDPALLGQRVTWTLADSCGECVPCRVAVIQGAGILGSTAARCSMRGAWNASSWWTAILTALHWSRRLAANPPWKAP